MFGRDYTGRAVPGRPIPARLIDRLAAAAGAVGRFRGGAGAPSGAYPFGPTIRAYPTGPFPAVLSGASSPYGMTEIYPTTGGGWATKPGGRTCTSCAYEINGVSGLNGKHIPEMWPGAISATHKQDYRFVWNRYPDPCLAQLTVRVIGCDGVMVGAVVTVKDHLGVIVPYSPTSNTCTIGRNAPPDCGAVWCTWHNVTVGATYTVHVDPPARYISPGGDQAITIACGSNTVTFTCSGTLTDPNYDCVDSSYACCSVCNVPLPRSGLTLDDSVASIPLTWSSYQLSVDGGFLSIWTGTATRTPTCDVYRPHTDPYGNFSCQLVTPKPDVTLDFRFYCGVYGTSAGPYEGASYYGADVTYQYCFNNGVCYLSDAGSPTSLSGGVRICGSGAVTSAYTCDPPYFPMSVFINPVCGLNFFNPVVAWDKAVCLGYLNGMNWTVT